MIDLRDPAERDAAAGEYVLGTLPPDDHAAVAAALPGDAALRAAVYAWQDRLLALTARTPAADPAPALWPRIAAGLDWQALPGRAPVARTPWWQGLRFWQGLSAVGVAASLVLALRLVAPAPPAPTEGARYVAVLESPDDKRAAGWVVEVQAGGALRLVPVGDTPPVPPGRSLQFWTKPQGAAGRPRWAWSSRARWCRCRWRVCRASVRSSCSRSRWSPRPARRWVARPGPSSSWAARSRSDQAGAPGRTER